MSLHFLFFLFFFSICSVSCSLYFSTVGMKNGDFKPIPRCKVNGNENDSTEKSSRYATDFA